MMIAVVLSIKFVYILRIQIKQSINISLKSAKKCSWKSKKKSKAFIIAYSNNMEDIYKNIEDHTPGRTCDVLIFFEDMLIFLVIQNLIQ